MLSPLTISGLRHTLGDAPGLAGKQHQPAAAKPAKKPRPERVVMWRCPVCDELHDDEDDAEDCCSDPGDDSANAPDWARICPVCGHAEETARDAADCCLWREFGQQERVDIATAVQDGTPWLAAIQGVIGSLPQQLTHLINQSPDDK